MTNIEWTDVTWNPIRGCSRVSPGCVNCYAERQAIRHSGKGGHYEGLVDRGALGTPRWTGQIRTVPDKLDEPLRWKKPRRVFVNSMSDLFHEDVPNESIAAVFGVMMAASQHTFQVLTKRADRMRNWFRWLDELGGIYRYIRSIRVDGDRTIPDLFNAVARTEVLHGKTVRAPSDPWMQLFNAAAVSSARPLPNVWLGVSAEDQQRADERIPLLLQTPAAVRFVSVEPLLGPIDLRESWLHGVFLSCPDETNDFDHEDPCEGCPGWSYPGGDYCGALRGPKLDWVIVGGESGPGARPCDVAWIRSLVEQCRAAQVPVFCKQLGAHVISNGCTGPGEHWPSGVKTADTYRGHWRHLLTSKKGGAMEEWPPDLCVREWPTR